MSRRHLSSRSARAGVATPANNDAPSIAHNIVLLNIFLNDIFATPRESGELAEHCTNKLAVTRFTKKIDRIVDEIRR
jgi:hypothetical protein